MATDVIMPQMGESIAEGTITRWLVGVGEVVERDQPLLEISTDKVDAEIPSPASGTLLEVRFAEGSTVEVDQVIALIGEAQAADSSVPAPSSDSPSGDVRFREIIAEPAGVPSPSPSPGAGAEEPSKSSGQEAQVGRSGFASPVVKRIAAERGIDVGQVPGSGIHGRVTKRDILQYLESQGDQPVDLDPNRGGEVDPTLGVVSAAPTAAKPTTTKPAEGAPAAPTPRQSSAPPQPASRPPAKVGSTESQPASAPSELIRQSSKPKSPSNLPTTPGSASELQFSVPAYREGEPVEVEPMSRVRRLTAAHMLYSQQTSAHVTTVFDVDMTSVVAARKRVKDRFFEKTGTKLTFMPFLFRAVIDGLKTYPKFNAAIDGTDVVYKREIHLGMAVALDWGLLVPVIHHADRLNLVGLAKGANELADRARTKRLRPEDVQGGTFTVTNPGVFGSLFGTPLINQPQVAILCIGAIEKRPVVITDEDGNDGLGIRWMAYLALSYDHRLIDGADAEQFMVRVKQTLTDSSWDELSAYVG